MNAKIKKLWVAALRSGKYTQGEGALRTQADSEDGTPQYCCLGVLCDLHRLRTKRAGWTKGGPESDKNFSYYRKDCFVPDQVARWAGLSEDQLNPENDVIVYPNGKEVTLSKLNDGEPGGTRRRTFKEIARIIETQL